MEVPQRPPITDSPWFWVMMFSLMGLVALAAIHGKYDQRQSRIERQYQARDRVANGATADPSRREYSTPEATLIPLWPLAIALGAVAVMAAAMLVRERRKRGNRGRGRPGSLATGSRN